MVPENENTTNEVRQMRMPKIQQLPPKKMRKEILKLIICPQCKSKLSLKTNYPEEQIKEGFLECNNCLKNYEIKNGVPNLLLKQKSNLTQKSFSYEWQKYTRFYDKEYTSQFWEWLTPLTPTFTKNKIVLDAGCGNGRHALISSNHAKTVIGVDFSDSVYTAYELTHQKKNVHILKADIANLPFKKNTFDSIYSIGVLH